MKRLKKSKMKTLITVLMMFFSGQAIAQQPITVFKVPLDRPFSQSGLPDCDKLPDEDRFKPCYRIPDDSEMRAHPLFSKAMAETGCVVQLYTAIPFIPYPSVYTSGEPKCKDRFNSTVENIEVEFSSNNFDDMVKMMIEKFGPPTNIEERGVENKLGKKFKKSILTWTNERYKAILFNYHKTTDMSYFSIMGVAGMKAENEREKRKTDDLKNKF